MPFYIYQTITTAFVWRDRWTKNDSAHPLVEHNRRYFDKCASVVFVSTVDVNGYQNGLDTNIHQSIFCVPLKKERNSYKFGMTGVYNDLIYIWWNISSIYCMKQ